jgi:clan AA aspartic protease (TIGR02281 family)
MAVTLPRKYVPTDSTEVTAMTLVRGLIYAPLMFGLSLVAVARADEAAAVKALKEKGIVKTGIFLNVADEAEFAKKLRDDFKLKKNLQMAVQTMQMADQQNEQNEQAITMLNQQLILANQAHDISANNQIIGQLKLRDQASDKFGQVLREARSKANVAREDYMSYVLELGRLVEKIKQQYEVLPTDPDVQKAIKELDEATGKTYALAASKTFDANLKILKRIEDSVLSDEITLKDEGSKTYTCTVIFNEKYKADMCVDSGASVVLLPHRMLKEVAVEVPSDAPEAQFKIADGSIIKGKIIHVKSVRVGRFAVKDVECGVFGPEYPEAPALLGMSFLGNFNFKIDNDAGKLHLTKVEEPDKGHAKPAGAAKK